MRTGDSALATQKNVPWPDFSRLFGQARAVLLLAVSCLVLSSTCEAAPATDPTTAFALSVSDRMWDMRDDNRSFWGEAADKRTDVMTSDISLVFHVAVSIRYGATAEQLGTLKKVVRVRSAAMGKDTENYFRRVLAFSSDLKVPAFESDSISAVKGHMGFVVYYAKHTQEAEKLAHDLSRGLEGEQVDLVGRLGADERDIQVDVDLGPLLRLWPEAYDSLTRQIWSTDLFECIDAWLTMHTSFNYNLPRLTYVKNTKARDDFARLLYLCWDKYLSKPDEYVLRNRYISLRILHLAAGVEHPTAADEAMRQKLGVDPEKWKAYVQFIKDVRAGLWNDRLYPKGR